MRACDLVHRLDQILPPLHLRDGVRQAHHARLEVLEGEARRLVGPCPSGKAAEEHLCLGSGQRETMVINCGEKAFLRDRLLHMRIVQDEGRIHSEALGDDVGLQTTQAGNGRKILR